MAAWAAIRRSCKLAVNQWPIEDTHLASFLMPSKPTFPLEGTKLKCSACGREATFHATDLSYRK
jgi:hypothetical protein